MSEQFRIESELRFQGIDDCRAGPDQFVQDGLQFPVDALESAICANRLFCFMDLSFQPLELVEGAA